RSGEGGSAWIGTGGGARGASAGSIWRPWHDSEREMGGPMRLGVNIGYSGSALGIDLALIQEADRLGFHSVWCGEAYGSGAVRTIAWVAAQTTRIGVG